MRMSPVRDHLAVAYFHCTCVDYDARKTRKTRGQTERFRVYATLKTRGGLGKRGNVPSAPGFCGFYMLYNLLNYREAPHLPGAAAFASPRPSVRGMSSRDRGKL